MPERMQFYFLTLTRFSREIGFVVGEGTLQAAPGELPDDGSMRFGSPGYVLSWSKVRPAERVPSDGLAAPEAVK